MASTAPPISKLCYVDNVIFRKAKMSELVTLKRCLEKYCSWSGQMISVEKAGVSPSKGVSNQFLNQIEHSWGFKYVKDMLEGKLSDWKSKSVAQSILTYTMAGLQFPKRICDQLNAVVRRFWWNPKTKSSSFWTPIAWSLLCRPQKEGGLGFRKFWDFNQALISKLAWWI